MALGSNIGNATLCFNSLFKCVHAAMLNEMFSSCQHYVHDATHNACMSVYERIDAELIRRGKNWTWLGEAMGGYSIGRINNWKRRGVPASAFADIAHALGKTIDWVASGSDSLTSDDRTHSPKLPMTSTSVYPQHKGATSFPQQGTVSKSFTNITTLVPEVVSWDRIGDVLSMQHHGGEVYSALAMPGQFSRNVQVIQYPDDSLEPEIQSGELIAVDPGIEPWPGDIVVARGKVTGQYFAGRFVSNRSGGFKIRSNKPDRYADADHNYADVVAVMVARLSGRSGTRPVEFKGF